MRRIFNRASASCASQCEAAHDPVIEIELRALSASGAYRWIRLNGRDYRLDPEDGKAARALGMADGLPPVVRGWRIHCSAVASAISAVSGLEFFQALVLELVPDAARSRYCYRRRTPSRAAAPRLRTVAVAADGGRIEPNFEYALAGSPCEQVAIAEHLRLSRDMCGKPSPSDDTAGQAMNVESYFGVALISSTAGTPHGDSWW